MTLSFLVTPHALNELPQSRGRIAAAPHTRDGRHARIIPSGNDAVFDQRIASLRLLVIAYARFRRENSI